MTGWSAGRQQSLITLRSNLVPFRLKLSLLGTSRDRGGKRGSRGVVASRLQGELRNESDGKT